MQPSFTCTLEVNLMMDFGSFETLDLGECRKKAARPTESYLPNISAMHKYIARIVSIAWGGARMMTSVSISFT